MIGELKKYIKHNNLEPSALITIGEYLRSIANIPLKDSELLDVGKSFADYFQRSDYSRLMKSVVLEQIDAEIACYLMVVKNPAFRHFMSSEFRMQNTDALLKFTVFRGCNQDMLHYEEIPKWVGEFAAICHDFIVIQSLQSARETSSSELIVDLCKLGGRYGFPVLTQAGFTNYGDYIVCREGRQERNFLDRVTSYYNSLGFTDINACVKGCSNSTILVNNKRACNKACNTIITKACTL